MATSPQTDRLTITFRCPQALDGLLPRPVPAARSLPAWLRDLPQAMPNAVGVGENDTVRCWQAKW